MQISLHKQARTTPAIGKEIQESHLSVCQLSEKYGVTKATVLKWKHRNTVEDNPHTPSFIQENHERFRGVRCH